jgi:hypothetical protein
MSSAIRRAALLIALPLTAVACRQPIVHTRTVEERVDVAAMRTEPRTRVDSLRQAANQRADSAGALVDTIVAAPARLTLRVGDSLPFYGAMRLVARDRSGAEVHGFVPLFHVQPFVVATLRRGYLVAVDTGTAALLIRPMRFSSAGPTAPSPSLTRVPVHVIAR